MSEPIESPTPDPRAVLRGIILATLRSVPTGRWNAAEIADALLDQFDAEMEHWLIGVVPGPAGDIPLCQQIRMPDREPVSHWRYVLRSAPVPAAKRPGEAGTPNASDLGEVS